MSKQDPSEQVRFLVSCIGHTTNGRPDFSAVAEELGIVSKAAAQKRYERMLKANNVNASKPSAKCSDGDEKPVTPAKKRKTTAPATGSAKKKTRGKVTKTEDSDDEVKPPKSEEEEDHKVAKKEEEDDSGLSDPPSSPCPGS